MTLFNRLDSYRNEFAAGIGSATGFGKPLYFTGPQNILLSVHKAIDVWKELLVGMHGHSPFKIIIIDDVFKRIFLTKLSVNRNTQKTLENFILPTPVLAAIATLLFGIVMVHAIQHLAPVEWNDRNLIIAGFSLLLGIGGLFVAGPAYQALPLVVRILLKQAVVTGGIPLIALHALLNRDSLAPAWDKK